MFSQCLMSAKQMGVECLSLENPHASVSSEYIIFISNSTAFVFLNIVSLKLLF